MPQVEFVILVADEFLIEETNPVKYFTRPTTKVDRIDPSCIARIMSTCTADRKRGLKRCGDRLT
jgi:hypothetical protein